MSQSKTSIKTVLFDFMGTCLNWHSSIISALPSSLTPDQKSTFALEWRQAYFDSNTARLNSGKPPEDIDITHRRVLDELLSSKHQDIASHFAPEIKEAAIRAWHTQPAWPEVPAAIQSLRRRGYEVYVHANGTTRLQLDLVRSSGLQFDMLFSSELLGVYKPARESYDRVCELLKFKPEECVLVAAHVMDTRGAKNVGMKTVYVRRWSDDVLEDQEFIKEESDAYLEDMRELESVIGSL